MGRLNLLKTLIFLVPFLICANAFAMIDGITGSTFNFTARDGRISTVDGNSIYMWGYANGGGAMQYPGVTMIVNQGDVITVNLTNALTVPTSIVFPGQQNLVASGGAQGLLAREAQPGGTVSYTFVAARAGTYLYYSGTTPEVQVEMGLVGAIIVRPYSFSAAAPRAYSHSGTAYDRETLFLLTEIDPTIHEKIETQGASAVYSTDLLSNYSPFYWFINGRNAPDTMAPAFAPWLPSQPYNSMPTMHPGEKLLMRIANAGRDLHPFHHHGNHARVIAREGRLLESSPGAGPDNAQTVFTVQSVPGETVDAIFEWTGKGLGWDIYGTDAAHQHACVDNNNDTFDDTTSEYCPDHGKPFPVTMPDSLSLAFGGSYSGSPYLGSTAAMPPGSGGLNTTGGFTYMWHSHTEKEMTNFDIFPGGMMTMLVIEAPGVPIE